MARGFQGGQEGTQGLRWLLYRHSLTRSRKNTETLKALEKSNRRIYRAWRLKDEFEQFWDYRAPWAARRFIEGWTATAMRSRLEPIKKFVRMLRTHAEDILAFIRTRLTNAISEGLNRIIKIIKNRASGFRSLDLPPLMCPHPELGCGCGKRLGDRFRCGWFVAQ